MAVDKDKLSDDLKRLFINYQHRLENPMPKECESNVELIERYRSDPFFHAKVDALTYGVMNVIDRHIQ